MTPSPDETIITMGDVLRAAWQALMDDNLAERDRLCAVLERVWPQGVEAIPIDTPIPTEVWVEILPRGTPGSGRGGTG